MNHIYLFHGEDSYSSHKKVHSWLKQFAEKYDETSSQILEGGKMTAGDFHEAVSTLPFLCDKKMVVIKDLFADGNIEELRKVAEKLEKIPDHCAVIFLERKKADSRTTLFKKIKEIGQITEFPEPDKPALINWITKEFAEKRGHIAVPQAALLADRVGSNLWQMQQEVEKLTLFMNGQPVTAKAIEDLVSPNLQTSIFRLTDEISQKNLKGSLKTLRDLIESGGNLMQILFMIVRHIRVLIQIKDCVNKNISKTVIIKRTKEHPFVVSKAISQCKNFNMERLETIYKKLLQIDIATKTGKIRLLTDDQSELRLWLEKTIVEMTA